MKTFYWRNNEITVFNELPYGEHFDAWLNKNTNTIVFHRTSLPEVGKRNFSNWIGWYTVLSMKVLINANGYVLVVGEVKEEGGDKTVQLWSCDLT